MSEIANAKIDNAKDFDVLMPIYNLLEYSNNYSKYQKFYFNMKKMSQPWMMMVILLILLLVVLQSI